MSTLSSNSTTAQVNASYDDNSSYFEDRSVAKARAFVYRPVSPSPTGLASGLGAKSNSGA